MARRGQRGAVNISFGRNQMIRVSLLPSGDGGSPREISQVLAVVLRAEGYPSCVEDLNGQGIDPQSYINSLDQVGSFSDPA